MPQRATNESEGNVPARSSGTVISWWNQLHFSGRVIMSSVLFGFGLVLVGSILLAINANDTSELNDKTTPNDIPTKAPSNIVGPVVMGVGSFIVTIGVMMCLFETQVCRKKNGESSSLIPEDKKEMESATESSASEGHKQGNRKAKRCKGNHGKSHPKGKKQPKAPSPQSDPVTIESPRQLLTSSEDPYVTPTNTLTPHQSLLFHDDENQTSEASALNTSGPWGQSSDFQTPCTSFEDTSKFLNNSSAMNDAKDNLNASELQSNVNLNSRFQTPDEENVHTLVSEIQDQKVGLAQVLEMPGEI